MKRRIVSEEQWRTAARFLLGEDSGSTLSVSDLNKLHRLLNSPVFSGPRTEQEVHTILHHFGWRKQ